LSLRLHIGTSTVGDQPVFLTPDDLRSHVHGIGASQSGKSKLIELIARDLITKRKGFCLIDPHGYLYRDLLNWLIVMDFERPITLFNPSYEKRIIGFNPFQSEYTDDARLMTKAERLMSATMMAFGDDGTPKPRIKKLLKCLYYVLLETRRTVPALDCFLDYDRADERNAIIESLTSNIIKAQLREIYGEGKRGFQSYIEGAGNRLNIFTHPHVRRIIGITSNSLDLRSIINKQEILLVNLQPAPDDIIGEESNRVLGTFLINELWEITRRRETPVEFYLIIDECHRYLTDDIHHILIEAAKYGLHLFLFHQDMRQLRGDFPGAFKSAQTKLFFSTEERPQPQRHFALRRADHTLIDAETLNVKPFTVSPPEREQYVEQLTSAFLTSAEVDKLLQNTHPQQRAQSTIESPRTQIFNNAPEEMSDDDLFE
jgi:hypothetical protein